MKSVHWSGIEERGSLLGLKFLLWCYRLVGRRLIWVFLFPVVCYFFISDKKGRTASKQFLTRATGKQASTWMSLKHYCTFADAAFDKLDAWLDKIPLEDIEHTRPDAMQNIVNAGRGAILIGSHLGNLEVCRALGQGRYKTQINVLVFTDNAVKFNAILKQVAPKVEVNLISVGTIGPDTAILLQEKVEQGEIVVIVGDRTSLSTSGRVVYQPFLGAEAPFSQGPFILAALLKCPVYWLFCNKEQDKFKVAIEHVSDGIKLARGQRQEILAGVIAQYAERLSHYAMKYPYQWFNFYDFWQQDDHVVRLKSEEEYK